MKMTWSVLWFLLAVSSTVAALVERRRCAEAEERLVRMERDVSIPVEAPADPTPARDRPAETLHSCEPALPTAAEAREAEDLLIAERLYATAKRKLQASEFQAALDDLDQARKLDPGSEQIRDLFDEVARIMNRRPEEWQEVNIWSREPLVTKIEQTRIEVEIHMQQGERFLVAGDREKAATEFEAVVQTLKWLPHDIGMNDTLELAKARLRAARPESNGLGTADFSDGTAWGGIVDAAPTVGGAADTVGECGLFTREHFSGANDFYDIRTGSPYPRTTLVPDIPIETGAALNQGLAYQAPAEPPTGIPQTGSDLNQGISYVEPAPH